MSDMNDFPAIGFDTAKAVERLGEAGFSGMLLTSPENVQYTTGYTSLPSSGNPILYTLRNRLPYSSFVSAEGERTLMCWGFSAEGVNFGCDSVAGFNDFAEALEVLGEVLAAVRDDERPLGIESNCPHFFVQRLRELGIETAIVDRVIEDMRLIKTPAELDLIRRSTAIIEQCVAELYDVLKVGMSRVELMRIARTMLVEKGATGVSHLTFTFGGSNPEIEIAEPLTPGRLVTLDLGAIVGGYCSDNRRYAFTGELTDEVVETYEKMVAIVDSIGEMLVPGTTHAELFKRTPELYEEHGVKQLARFTHTGHNIGLETEERWLAESETETIEAGMAINIELYTQLPDLGQIGNEETYFITPEGPERISQLPRRIHEVR